MLLLREAVRAEFPPDQGMFGHLRTWAVADLVNPFSQRKPSLRNRQQPALVRGGTCADREVYGFRRNFPVFVFLGHGVAFPVLRASFEAKRVSGHAVSCRRTFF